MVRWVLTCLFALVGVGLAAAGDRPVSVVLFYADDLGYADLGCFGAKSIMTPHIDRMAADGVRATSFYTAQAVCSASRAALLTGKYPQRVGVLGALGPKSTVSLPRNELNLAKLAKSAGLATGIFGKWHLGCQADGLPTEHGFDEYFGLPYSNDMSKWHPTVRTHPPLPLYAGTQAIEMDPPMDTLTSRTIDRAVDFVRKHRGKSFFLYVPFTMPHVPLGASKEFRGRSPAGLYGDVIEEIDHSVGRVLDALREAEHDRDALVIFTSDNGPWLAYGNHAGSAGPLREGKGTAFEGGVRVPFVARWPGRIPAGTACDQAMMTIDVLPTLARVWGRPLPADPQRDGWDVHDVLTARPEAVIDRDALYFFYGQELHAVRSGRWKLHVPHGYVHIEKPGADGLPGKVVTRKIGVSLFDLEADIGESTDVADRHPEVVARLTQLAERARAEITMPPRK